MYLKEILMISYLITMEIETNLYKDLLYPRYLLSSLMAEAGF